MMIASKAAIAVCSFVLVAAGGAAIVIGTNGLWQAVQSGPKADVKADAKPDGKVLADSQARPESRPDFKPEAKTETKVETKPEAKVASAAPGAPVMASPTPPSARTDVNTALGQVK